MVCRKINVEIVKRTEAGKFVVLPRRWGPSGSSDGSIAATAWPRTGSA